MVYDKAIVDLHWGHLGLRRTAALGPFFGDTHSFHTRVEGMRAPGVRRAASPSLPTAFIGGDGGLGGGGTGKPAGFHAPDVHCETLGFLGLGRGIRHSGLVSPLAGVDHQEAYLCHVEASVSVFHFHLADDTGPVPASRCLLAGAARFFEHERQRPMLLAPGLHLLAHGTRARDYRHQSHAWLQAQPQGAFTVGLTIGDNAAYPIESPCQALLNGHGGLSAVTGMAIAHAEAEWEALTAHAETQEHLLEIIMSIFAVPIRRTRWDWPLTPVGLLLIGPIEGDCRRILVQPGVAMA